jgi:hypothetical protein
VELVVDKKDDVGAILESAAELVAAEKDNVRSVPEGRPGADHG